MSRELFYYSALLNDANLVGYWRMAGNWNDSSTKGYNLTATNSPTFAAGKFGGCGSFALASSQYTTIASASCASLDMTGSRTIIAWIKTTYNCATGNPTIVAKRGDANGYRGWDIYLSNTTAKPTFTITGGITGLGNVAGDSAVNDGNWHMITGRYDGSNVSMFTDLTKKDVVTTGSSIASGVDFHIGSNQTGGVNNFFDGLIDEVIIFDRALSDAEITNYYNAKAVGGSGTLLNML